MARPPRSALPPIWAPAGLPRHQAITFVVGGEEDRSGVPGFMTRPGHCGQESTAGTGHTAGFSSQDRSPTRHSFLLKLAGSAEGSNSWPYPPRTVEPTGWVTNSYSKTWGLQSSQSRCNTPGPLLSPSLTSLWSPVHHPTPMPAPVPCFSRGRSRASHALANSFRNARLWPQLPSAHELSDSKYQVHSLTLGPASPILCFPISLLILIFTLSS